MGPAGSGRGAPIKLWAGNAHRSASSTRASHCWSVSVTCAARSAHVLGQEVRTRIDARSHVNNSRSDTVFSLYHHFIIRAASLR